MPAYAVAHLQAVEFGPGITEYLTRIDATLAPFGGGFMIHGARPLVLEGQWRGDLVVIAFPDLAKAQAWYASPAYQEIIRLRTDHSQGVVMLVDGVDADHRSIDLLSA